MSAGRVVWIVLIVIFTSIAWAILGRSVSERTQEANANLRAQVEGLWGSPLTQAAPSFQVSYETGSGRKTKTRSEEVRPDRNYVVADLKKDLRRKGLLWYRCYKVTFSGDYLVTNPHDFPVTATATLALPTADAVYENFRFEFGGKQATPSGSQTVAQVRLEPHARARLRVGYVTRGLETWAYAFNGRGGAQPVSPAYDSRMPMPPPASPAGGEGVASVRDFTLVVTTDFDKVNFPARTISPSTREPRQGGGQTLTWKFASLISGFSAGVEMPEKLDAGPVAARIAQFAPVGLLFFVAVLVIIGAMQGRNLHPMHYFFLASAFFSFHLLFAYLADHLALGVTFLIAAGTSLLLVGSYVGRALGASFTCKVILPAQLLFLVLFSYAFFFRGYTGLTITIASILTLFILMQVTAKVDWENKLGAAPGRTAPPPPPPA